MPSQVDQINDLISAIKQDEEKLDTKDLDAAVGAATTLALSRARDTLDQTALNWTQLSSDTLIISYS